MTGLDAFVADVTFHAQSCPDTQEGKRRFIRIISYEYSHIRLSDWRRPIQFLRQAEGNPPKRFGQSGFEPTLVDDDNPARHYTAFVFIGFWFPSGISTMILWLWEFLGFIRYGFWSQEDMHLGRIGIRHGRQISQIGPSIMPQLIEQELSAQNAAL